MTHELTPERQQAAKEYTETIRSYIEGKLGTEGTRRCFDNEDDDIEEKN